MLKLSTQTLFIVSLSLSLLTCKQHQDIKEIVPLNTNRQNNSDFKNFMGINGFEWDFFDKKTPGKDPARLKIMQSFGGFRHYLDWERIEPQKGKYTFSASGPNGFDYDSVYQFCVANRIEVLTCLKNCPPWLVNTYPKDERDVDNVPAVYGLNRSDPASYVEQARAAFQFAARYGSHQLTDTSFIKTAKSRGIAITGLGYVHYIECDNERDKTWKGNKGHQNPEEYAADLSAFYDGHMGKLGKNAGVKNADPAMKVVMAGLADPDPEYVIKMIDWCKKHRGYHKDGSVNLCFDIINYHLYNNDAVNDKDKRTTGKAPELSLAGKVADEFMAMSRKKANNTEVWITESGYDLHPGSPQRAIQTGSKPALITQADWILRSSFLYARHGLKRSFFYMLDDVSSSDATPYASSGFAAAEKPRPVADYFRQAGQLIGAYHYEKTINKDPIVDVYKKGNQEMYILYVPDEKDRKAIYELDLQDSKSAKIHLLNPGAEQMRTEKAPTRSGKIRLRVTETPVFVEKN